MKHQARAVVAAAAALLGICGTGWAVTETTSADAAPQSVKPAIGGVPTGGAEAAETAEAVEAAEAAPAAEPVEEASEPAAADTASYEKFWETFNTVTETVNVLPTLLAPSASSGFSIMPQTPMPDQGMMNMPGFSPSSAAQPGRALQQRQRHEPEKGTTTIVARPSKVIVIDPDGQARRIDLRSVAFVNEPGFSTMDMPPSTGGLPLRTEPESFAAATGSSMGMGMSLSAPSMVVPPALPMPDAEEAPAAEAPAEEAPADEAPAEEAPGDEASVDEAPPGEAPIEEASTEEASSGAADAETAAAEADGAADAAAGGDSTETVKAEDSAADDEAAEKEKKALEKAEKRKQEDIDRLKSLRKEDAWFFVKGSDTPMTRDELNERIDSGNISDIVATDRYQKKWSTQPDYSPEALGIEADDDDSSAPAKSAPPGPRNAGM